MKQFTFNFGFIETGCCRALEDLAVTTQPRLIFKQSAASEAGITGVHHHAQLEQSGFQGTQTLVQTGHRRPGWQLNIMDEHHG